MQSLTDQINRFRQLHPLRWRASLIVGIPVATILVLLIGFSIVFAGRIYPGVKLNGVAVGGMTTEQAQAAMARAAGVYGNQTVPIQYGNTTVRVTPNAFAVAYSATGAKSALAYGRTGSGLLQAKQRLQQLFATSVNVQRLAFSDERLAPYLAQIDDDVATPVANAGLSMSDGQVAVTPSQPGKRLDLGYLVAALQQRLGSMSSATIIAPIYDQQASINEQQLDAARAQAAQITSGPLSLRVANQNVQVPASEIVKWIGVSSGSASGPAAITGVYPVGQEIAARLSVDQSKIQQYVGSLAGQIDQDGQNATLGVQDGKVIVTAPSKKGLKLDQAAAVAGIQHVLEKPGANRKLTLAVKQTEPEVNEGNLDQLGLKELISTGQTLFPGSPSTRLINVSTGAAKMNNVLIKPGENFSFDDTLGPIGPETGYVPELVILADHEEKQYGGGLCQVSSTVYRAALGAGLPITQRTNHAFAISYYTAPYGVPGVDATIYPDSGVDMRFRNDTGHYILMQTIMNGTTLTANFYGTKTKSGVIRGPEFVSGTNDAKQPSHTRFYRDVVDLAGNVTKTDTIDTYYKASTDFPVDKQIN